MRPVNPPLIAIIGPTASGKSKLAIRLAKKFRGAVISADSQQIYRHAQIGTNQPSGKWRRFLKTHTAFMIDGVPHFFINTLSPNSKFSCAKFQRQTNSLITRLYSAGYLPILSGGSMLYVSALVESYQFPKGGSLRLRKKLNQLDHKTLTDKLKQLDYVSWSKIDTPNRRRLIRALEYILSTGQSFWQNRVKSVRPNTLIIGLRRSGAVLRKSIENRTHLMIKRGLVKEVAYLKRHYPASPLLRSLGYREIVNFLAGKISIDKAEQQIISHTWRYTKKQLAWFKKLPNVHWITQAKSAYQLIHKFLRPPAS